MSFFFEIVELSGGDVVLRRADELDADPLVTIHFSDLAKAGLCEHHLDVARVMLEAGVRKVGALSGLDVEREDYSSAEYQAALH